MKHEVVVAHVGGKEIKIETGKLAKQSDGSVLVTCGSNIVLVTAVSSREASTADFFPLTVEYQEKFYATGKIPGGYFKREGKPTTEATLTSRLIDRPIRPLFPEGYRNETQVVATVLSADGTYPLSVLANLLRPKSVALVRSSRFSQARTLRWLQVISCKSVVVLFNGAEVRALPISDIGAGFAIRHNISPL